MCFAVLWTLSLETFLSWRAFLTTRRLVVAKRSYIIEDRTRFIVNNCKYCIARAMVLRNEWFRKARGIPLCYEAFSGVHMNSNKKPLRNSKQLWEMHVGDWWIVVRSLQVWMDSFKQEIISLDVNKMEEICARLDRLPAPMVLLSTLLDSLRWHETYFNLRSRARYYLLTTACWISQGKDFDHLSSQVSTRTSYHRMVQTIWGLHLYCLWFGWSKALHHQDNMYMIVARPDRGHCAYHNVQTENDYVWFWSLVCQSNQRNICMVYAGARWAKSVCPRSKSHTSCLVRSCPMMFFSSLLVIGCNNKV
jgi:hypothetical protein